MGWILFWFMNTEYLLPVTQAPNVDEHGFAGLSKDPSLPELWRKHRPRKLAKQLIKEPEVSVCSLFIKFILICFLVKLY